MENKIGGYEFKDISLLKEAMSHSSYNQFNGGVNYERFEFLGDAVLGFVIADLLIKFFPCEKEGDLAKRRAALVCGDTLANVARKIGVDTLILMSSGEDINGGRENDAILEDATESLIAAIYLDGGIDAAYKFIKRHFCELIEDMDIPPKDPKTHLQEWAQGRGLPIPVYNIVSQTGPSHAPLFVVEVSVVGNGSAKFSGSSKKSAERGAALLLLDSLHE